MSTTREDIARWIAQGREQKATHIIVVCDTFSYEDYPVYVTKDEDILEKKKEYNGINMQRIMEVINL